MKRIMNKSIKDEKGQVLVLAMILMLVGGLIIVPLLGFMSTGLIVGRVFEDKMAQAYAADAGVEDAIYNIITPAAPYYGALDGLDVNEESALYTLTDINGLSVSYTVTKLSLLAGFVDDSEYKVGQPHEDWVTFDAPLEVAKTATYVEYETTANFTYTGAGNRQVITIGSLFSPHPGDDSLIVGPYDIVYTPVIVADGLEAGSPELVTGSSAFAFIWRWGESPYTGPLFNSGDTGSLGFKFKIMDPDWEYSNYFIWATFKENDVSYVTSDPDSYNWLIEATAGDTTVRSYVLTGVVGVDVLTWEIS